MSAQPADPGPSLQSLEEISHAALEAAQKATSAAEAATAAATAAAEKAASFGLSLPAELLEQIGNVSGAAAAAATEERLRQLGALRDLGDDTTPPAAGTGDGDGGPPDDGEGDSPPPAVDPVPGEPARGKSWAERFLGE